MVKITTDTTSMYTVAQGKEMGIDLVPMTLIAGDKSYREIEEINVDELKVLIEEGVKLTTSQPAVGEVMDLFEEASEEIIVKNVNGIYYVECERIINVINSINFNDYESMAYFQKVLRNSGIIDALEQKGIK